MNLNMKCIRTKDDPPCKNLLKGAADCLMNRLGKDPVDDAVFGIAIYAINQELERRPDCEEFGMF